LIRNKIVLKTVTYQDLTIQANLYASKVYQYYSISFLLDGEEVCDFITQDDPVEQLDQFKGQINV